MDAEANQTIFNNVIDVGAAQDNYSIDRETIDIRNREGIIVPDNRILCSIQQKRKSGSIAFEWDYANPCIRCDYVHLKGATVGQKSKCCLNGQAMQEPYPQLKPLPPKMLVVAWLCHILLFASST